MDSFFWCRWCDLGICPTCTEDSIRRITFAEHELNCFAALKKKSTRKDVLQENEHYRNLICRVENSHYPREGSARFFHVLPANNHSAVSPRMSMLTYRSENTVAYQIKSGEVPAGETVFFWLQESLNYVVVPAKVVSRIDDETYELEITRKGTKHTVRGPRDHIFVFPSEKLKRNRSTSKRITNCKMYLRCCWEPNYNQWVVTKYNPHHSGHRQHRDGELRMAAWYARMNNSILKLAKTAAASAASPAVTARMVQREAGSQFLITNQLVTNRALAVDDPDYETLLQSEFSCCTAANRADLVVSWYSEEKKFIGWRQGFKATSFGLPMDIPHESFPAVVWTSKHQLLQWARNPSILIFDDTFNTNKEDRFLFTALGVDSNKRNSPLLRAFLPNGKTRWYEWIFSKALPFLVQRHLPPEHHEVFSAVSLLLSDEAKAFCKLGARLANSVYPNAVHRICIWHVVWHPFENLPIETELKDAVKAYLWDALHRAETRDEYEQRMQDMDCFLRDKNVTHEKLLDFISNVKEKREKISYHSCSNTYHGGMLASSRAESEQRAVKSVGLLNKHSSQAAVIKACKTKETRVAASEKAAMARQEMVELIDPIHLIHKIQRYVMPNVLRDLQQQIKGIPYIQLESCSADGTVVLKKSNPTKPNSVGEWRAFDRTRTLKRVGDLAVCSCNWWTRTRQPCRHILWLFAQCGDVLELVDIHFQVLLLAHALVVDCVWQWEYRRPSSVC